MKAADPCLQLGRPLRSESEARTATLREIRSRWRYWRSLLWTATHEVFTSSRVQENERKAKRRCREIAGEYAVARGWELRRAA